MNPPDEKPNPGKEAAKEAKPSRAAKCRAMKHIEFCIPTAKKVVPSGPDWFHEVKYDPASR